MPTGRHGHPCAALVLNNTKVLVIADLYYPSRSKRVDFLIQDKWISGPSLPNYYHDAHELVSNGETLFYVNTYDNVFLRMECESINSCIWIEMEQKLQIPRSNAVVKLIPDHLAECSIAPTTTSTKMTTGSTSMASMASSIPTTTTEVPQTLTDSKPTPTTSSKGTSCQATFSAILCILVSLIFNKLF